MALRPRSTEWRTILRAALIAAVVAFALTQILTSFHAAKYGDSTHEHFGQACVLSLAAPGGEKLVATAGLVFAAAVLMLWRVCFVTARRAPALVRIHSTQPRAPPNR